MDKRCKSSTKDEYLSLQVEVQPCFKHDILTELTDLTSSNLQEIDVLLLQQQVNPTSSSSSTNNPLMDQHNQLDVFESEMTEVLHSGSLPSLEEKIRNHKIGIEEIEILGRVFLRNCPTISLENCKTLLTLVHDLNLMILDLK